ncbi:hypothetical protein ScPMuIL_010557 [Solemya velum]
MQRQSSKVMSAGRTVNMLVYRLREYSALLKCGGFFGLGVLLWKLGLSCPLVTATVAVIYLLTGGWRFAWVAANTLRRDVRAFSILIRIKLGVHSHVRNNMSTAKLFRKTVRKFPQKNCFMSDEKCMTFQEVEERSNAIANYFHDAGYSKGDTIAVFMENSPEFVCLWLGLSKVGMTAALINFNLRGPSLSHCINISEAKSVVFGGELSMAIKEVLPSLSNNPQLYCSSSPPTTDINCLMLDVLLEKSPTFPPPSIQTNFKDKLFFVFTSGTTGMPKAAVITHTRLFYMTSGVKYMFSITDRDTIYNTLPLYHANGGAIGVGLALIWGSTVVLRRKFSASRFWDDCIRYKCTVAQYIGEICRYLLVQPYKASDTQHTVKLMFGNGLRPQIWEEFQQRFGVKQIGEFYGATEGNCNILNSENKVGAVGFASRLVPALYPITLIRVDRDTGEPIRDRYGVCIKAQPGEPGELVGKIIRGDPMREFDGYICKKATDKKIARDVFTKGDHAFLTGDILVMDDFGFMYFRDRTGDTYRWRGENVSTSEIESVIQSIVKLQDAVVYGVDVPGIEGRAGMAAIVDTNDNIDLHELNSAFQRSLPGYARPVFLRFLPAVDTTGTFKLKKTELREEAFNPNVVKDKLFWLNSKSGQYEFITPAVYSDICQGRVRL